jgi:Arc-like DNA binding domain
MAKRKDEIVSTRLRLPTGLHRLLTASAKRNNRSLNSEVLWCIAQQLGGEAHKLVEQMAVEQRRAMHRVLQALIKDPQRAAQAIANFDKGMGEKS